MNFTPEATMLEVHLAGNMPASRPKEKDKKKKRFSAIIMMPPKADMLQHMTTGLTCTLQSSGHRWPHLV